MSVDLPPEVPRQTQPLGAIGPSVPSSTTPTPETGTQALRQSEMSSPPSKGEAPPSTGWTHGGDTYTLSVLEHLGEDSRSNAFFTGDAKDYLSNRGNEGLYFVQGPKNEKGEQKTFVFYKSGTVALSREMKEGDEIPKILEAFSKVMITGGRREPNEGTKARLAQAEAKAKGMDPEASAIKGGSETKIAEEITGAAPKKSRGFFGFLFGGSSRGTKAGRHHRQAADLSVQHNVRASFKEVRASEPPKTFESFKAEAKAFDEQFISLTVANKNLQAGDSRREELLQPQVRGAIQEIGVALRDIENLKKQVKRDPAKKEELKFLEKGLRQKLAVLKSIAGEPRDSKLNRSQKRALELLEVDVKVRTHDQARELSNLVNRMSREELQGLVDEQAIRCLESPENPAFNPLALCGKLVGLLTSDNPNKKIGPPEWQSKSPCAILMDQERKLYGNTFRALSETVTAQEAGYKKAQEDIALMYGGVLEVLSPQATIADCLKARISDLRVQDGKLREKEANGEPGVEKDRESLRLQGQSLKKVIEFIKANEENGESSPREILSRLIESQEAELRAAKPEEREALMKEQGAVLKALLSSFSALAKDVAKDLDTGAKDEMMADIREIVPQFAGKPFDSIPQFHGLDKILMHLTSPAATDTLFDGAKKALNAGDKLAGIDQSHIGL